MAKVDSTKKKKPPTFQHLPEIQAKKLKRSWVQAQKIKSQWKAQKRKEGLIPGGKRPVTDRDSADIDERPESTAEEESDEEAVSDAEPSTADDNPGQEYRGESDNSGAEVEVIAPAPSTQQNTLISRSGIKRKQHSNFANDSRVKAARQHESALRPQPKLSSHGSRISRQNQDAEPRKGPTTGGRGSTRGNSRGGQRKGRGRGQPNMGARMNVVLEKIKRDFA